AAKPAPVPAPPVTTAALTPAPTAEPAPPPPQAAPPPPPRPQVSLPRDEVVAMMKRGRDLLTTGDIAGARLILTRIADAGAADAGGGGAWVLLAPPYDAAEIARARMVGAVPDAAKARNWYGKAAEQGSAEASRRLQQLSSR